jgi:ADP-ribosyl-[dinitrogen reductase] hydrolase
MPGGGPFQLAAGQVTDDSEHALCLAYALIEKQKWDYDTVAKYYRFWVNSRPFDIGNNTRMCFQPLIDKSNPKNN